MKHTINFFALLFIATQLFSCFGYTVKSKTYPYNGFSGPKLESPKPGWEKIPILYEVPPVFGEYIEMATIVITGNESTKEPELLRRMRQEAGKYSADAIISVRTREVTRETTNGFLLTMMLVSIINSPAEDCEEEEEEEEDNLEVSASEEYYALELEGIAIKYLDD